MVAESLGAYYALTWVRSFTNQHLLVESDCLNLVNGLKDKAVGWNTKLQYILLDCLDLVSYFQVVEFLHVRREGNVVTHELTKFSKTVVDEMSLYGYVPQCILPCIEADIVRI